jgi:NADH-dependent peroxiredoxin subunit F
MDPKTAQPTVVSAQLYDVIIVGGGPAGVAAAVYTARKQLKTLMITDSFGGQSIVSDDIQNWIGEAHTSGVDLAQKMEAHVRAYPDMVDIKTDKVIDVSSIQCSEGKVRICDFDVKTQQGQVYKGKTVIIASGARRRKLGIPGEDKFAGKGMAYCSTCDAPLFKDKKVAVVGGGNAGLEAVHDLFQYATEIYLVEFGDMIKGDGATFSEIKQNPKLKEVLLNTQTLEVLGDTFVTGLKVKDRTTNVERTLEVGGIFAEIGSIPNSEMVKTLVQIDEHGQVIINFQHARTSHPGVFAAGDVTNDPYKQNNISVGDGVRAALAAYAYLLDRAKTSPAEERPHA